MTLPPTARLRALDELHRGADWTDSCCEVSECCTCAVLDCPDGDPLHYHHEGCPSCSQSLEERVVLLQAELDKLKVQSAALLELAEEERRRAVETMMLACAQLAQTRRAVVQGQTLRPWPLPSLVRPRGGS